MKNYYANKILPLTIK